MEELQEGELCDNTCGFPADGACDDGGPDSKYAECDYGTDCVDCELRIQSPAAPPAPPAAPPAPPPPPPPPAPVPQVQRRPPVKESAYVQQEHFFSPVAAGEARAWAKLTLSGNA